VVIGFWLRLRAGLTEARYRVERALLPVIPFLLAARRVRRRPGAHLVPHHHLLDEQIVVDQRVLQILIVRLRARETYRLLLLSLL